MEAIREEARSTPVTRRCEVLVAGGGIAGIAAALAAARGGYGAVCAMPNLQPAPDSLENLRVELRAIRKDACVAVYPYGCITMGQRGGGHGGRPGTGSDGSRP